MPKANPREFQRGALDLVTLGEPAAQVAKGLGISEQKLRCWMAQGDVDSGSDEGLTSAEKRELIKLRRKTRVLETENEILNRASAHFVGYIMLPN